MPVVRDGHHQIVAGTGVRREADPEQSADRDAVLVLEDGSQGSGAGVIGAARSRLRIARW
ncbi:hypothetical protein [Streptomyces sp. NPDC059378]|uniref:hypothetical protein n=1 Tax=Streptomyces sp. NPDC059378 TaxID=3346815 RepID=UPI0036C18DD1